MTPKAKTVTPTWPTTTCQATGCGKPVVVGDAVRYAADGFTHADCKQTVTGGAAPAGTERLRVCGVCATAHQGACPVMAT